MVTAYLWSLAGLLFVSEVLMLGVLGGGVWAVVGRGWPGVLAGLAAVAAAVALWALFASPRPVMDVTVAKYAVKIGLYVAATALLAAAGARLPTVWAFAVFSLVVNTAAVMPPYRDF
ncbi:DUF2568 domain-containing protein [Gordonia sp. PDNC005]|uniref:DUF2568 domain-containing protein n=1 Tax=unclassified Gordonia (in: high G+C Gram-positive bacteria) TaxID=2657482 RepID=UPI001963B071|nr:DUF2568 domain-containing protein [Gordonia sp. PDNC005]QRY61209.1 DUF2568 domain-containing protein [Gordonia sp. PDNC005]